MKHRVFLVGAVQIHRCTYLFFGIAEGTTERPRKPTPSPGRARGWLGFEIASVTPSPPSVTDISQCSAVTGQTFRPIVRPLLSALTTLDPTAAAAPDNPNLFGLDPFSRFHQQSALFPTRACRIDSLYGSRPRERRSCSPKALEQGARLTSKKPLLRDTGLRLGCRYMVG